MTAPISDETAHRDIAEYLGRVVACEGSEADQWATDILEMVRAALQEPVEDRLLHPEELRRFLGIKTPALKRSLARLGIPVINVGGHVRVSERMLNDWIRESSRPLPWGKDHDDEAEDTQDET
jgi:hypothetical protein